MLGTPLGRILLDRPAWTYLLGPFFKASTPDQAAPLSATYREAGAVGSLAITDTNSIMSTSGGVRVVNGTAAANDGAVSPTTFARQAGRALLVQVPTRTTVVAGSMAYGWSTTNNDTAVDIGLDYSSTTAIRLKTGSTVIATLTIGSGAHEWLFVQRGTGGLLLNRVTREVLWVYNTVTSAEYAKIGLLAAGAQQFTDAQARVVDLGGAWASDYGIATSRLTNPSTGATSTMQADALVEATFAYTASGAQDFALRYRVIDGSNFWMARIGTDGSVNLYQDQAGVLTLRANTAGGVVTTGTHRMVVVAVGNVHTIYVDNTQRCTYTDAGNFAITATGTLLAFTGATCSEQVCWPRTVSLPTGV